MRRVHSAAFLFLLFTGAVFPACGATAPNLARLGAKSRAPASASDVSGDLLKKYEEESVEESETIADPLKLWNKTWFHFNDKLYFWFIKPVSTGYGFLFYPRVVRVGIRNFIVNLGFPGRFFNNALQGRPIATASELARFLLNTTLGVVGFWDPATRLFHLKTHPEDFDQTLGVWRIGMGVYLTWPFMGPSSIRGTFGLLGDWAFDPVVTTWPIVLLNWLNSTSLGENEYETLLKMALDPYTAIRTGYVQNRKKLIAE